MADEKAEPGAEPGVSSTIHHPPSTIPHAVRCVFAPSLASIVHSSFQCVVCDEAVAIKSGTSYMAQGVLRMAPAYRLALTGTPIKNKFPDIFFLASWVTGFHPEPTARWPYPNTVEGRAQFAADFGVVEENLTKQEKAAKNGKPQRFVKTDATRICNVHKLWRLLGPVLIRRRKDELPGNDIVPKRIVPIHVVPGRHQQAVYGYQVSHPVPQKSLLATLGVQLNALRQAALFPASPKLARLGIPAARSAHTFTPKTAALLKLATDLMAQGEQLVIASPFVEFSKHLSAVLTDAAIPHLQLDGGTGPVKRGKEIKRFKSGAIPVVILGIKGMASGHNLDNCHHLALPGLEWALDLNWQIVDRVHRLTSKKEINIYVLITKGTTDMKLADGWQIKGDSSNLALDARLIREERKNMDIAEFLGQAVADFDPSAETLDEAQIEANWHASGVPAIRDALATYRRLRPIQKVGTDRRAVRVSSPVKPLDRPAVPIVNPQSSIDNPPRPRTLFELMKSRRQPQAPTPPPAPPAPTRTALPLFKPRITPPKQPVKREPLTLR